MYGDEEVDSAEGKKTTKMRTVVFGLQYAELSSVSGFWLQVYVGYAFGLPEVEGEL